MRGVDQRGDYRRKEREAQVFGYKFGPVRVQGRVEEAFDAGEIDAAILGVRVVAVDRQGQGRQAGDQDVSEGPFGDCWFVPFDPGEGG